MTEEQRNRLIRIGAVALLRLEMPTAPAGAANEASEWWRESEAVINAIEPYWNSLRYEILGETNPFPLPGQPAI